MSVCFFQQWQSLLRKFLLISGLLFAQPVWADSPYIVKVQHYSLGEGLPNRGVLSIGQDRQGFIWIGTLDNAYRFDGHTFNPLLLKPISAVSPVTKVVNHIRTDSDGNPWFFSLKLQKNSQLSVLGPDHETAVPFEKIFQRQLPFDLSAVNLSQLKLTSSVRPSDPIFLYHSDGSVWQHKSRGQFKRFYQHPTPVAPKNLLITPTGTVLVNYPSVSNPSENELVELWPNGTVRRQQRIPAALHPIGVDSQGTIYLSYVGKSFVQNNFINKPRLSAHQIDAMLYRLSPAGQLTNVPIVLPKNPFPNPAHYNFTSSWMVYDEKHGLFWFLGENVLFAWHPTKGIVFDLAASDFPIASLIDFNHLYVDRTGAVWIGTQNGFLLLTLEPNHFRRYLYVPDEDIATTKLSTRGIVKIGNNLWVGTNVGRMIDLKTGKSRTVTSQECVPAFQSRDNHIWTVMADSLVRIDPVTLAMQKFPLHYSHFCWALWRDGRQNFWIGYDSGISYYDSKQKRLKPFTHYHQFQELAQSRVNGLYPDSTAGDVWVASVAGLYLLDTLRGITARYSSRDKAPNYLPFDNITFVHPDRDQRGIYWLATLGGGLIRWERHTGRWQQFTQQQGLSNNHLYSVHEDRSGRLWLPSNYGLMQFHKQTHQVQLFLPKDGIAHEEFNLTSHFTSPDGQLFLGGLNGITAFRPDDQIAEKPVVVPLMVTQYDQLNANTGARVNYLPHFQQNHRIVIPPENRSFSLSFALLDYRYSRQFRLFYRILNWQNYWTSQLHRDLSINGLPPGNYQLEVRAQNPNGQWVSETLTIPIKVLKPFYRQTWFLILFILSLGGIAVGVFWWRNNRLVQETKRLEAEVTRRTAQIEKDKAVIEQQAADLQASATLKSRFFANVSHEFRTPLTLLLGPLSYLSRHSSEPTMTRLVNTMDRNARQLLSMVSDLLDLSKLDVSKMKLVNQPADLVRLIHQVVAAFAPQAEYAGIRLTVELPETPLWLVLDVTKVETVLKNLLANALRFTPSEGTVSVQLHKSTEWFRIEVSDTGSGIHPDDLAHIFERYYQSQQPDAPVRGGTGIGLALSHEYCTLWGGELTVESQLGKGSTFAFTHPNNPAIPPETAPVIQTSIPEFDSVPIEKEINHLIYKVLLVEDNADMVDYLETILSPHYQLHITRNGCEAWQWLNERTASELPQLIVTDLMMPDMDGLALVDQLRQKPTVRDIPVLMLTARTSQDVKLKALRMGVADFVTKPFDQDELVTRINNLLDRSQERTAWQQQLPDEIIPSVSLDEVWLLQIEQLVLKNLTNTTFQVYSIADAVHTSERQLYRRMKKLTGFSPNQFIQEIRLQTAREWLENQDYTTVKEVSYAVGFQDPVYFSRLFLQRFGRYPATFLRTAENV